MLSGLPALLAPVLSLVVIVFLILRLGFFSRRAVEGRYPFLIGGALVFVAAVWETVGLAADYSEWFVVSAYAAIDLAQFACFAGGVLLMVIGLAFYADYWNTQAESIEARQGKLAILENLQHDARQPYHLLELLNQSLKEILVHYPSTSGAVFLVNRSRRQFVLTSFSGLSKQETALLEHYPLERNIVSQAVELGDPVLSARFDFVDRSGKPVQSRFNSCLILPLASGLEKIGGLLLFSEENRRFSRTDIGYLSPVAQWLAEKILSARLQRELASATRQVGQHSTELAETVSRYDSAAKAIVGAEAISRFCSSLSGLAQSESVHLCGLKRGDLSFYGGSEPLTELTENYKTALMDAIDRDKPLIINQEAAAEGGGKSTVMSSLVFPLRSGSDRDALLLLRTGRPFAVSDRELKQIESLANMAGLVLRQDSFLRLGLTRRKGFDVVLRLLQSDECAEGFIKDPGCFLRHITELLPTSSIGLALTRDVSGVLTLAEVTGSELTPSQARMQITAGEGDAGKAAISGESAAIFGRTNVARHLEAYGDVNRSLLRRMLGERGTPAFVAHCPILTGQDVVGVVIVYMYEIDESQRGEWERLLTLAAGLYSLRLSIDQLRSGQLASLTEGADSSGLGAVVNHINNHLSAVIGSAELLNRDDSLPGEARLRMEQIIAETEKASAFLSEVLPKPLEPTPSIDEEPVPVASTGGSLDRVIEAVLQRHHISGDVYMAGQRPREISLRLGADKPILFTSIQMREMFESVIEQFAARAEEEDAVTISTYVRNNYVFLDISRHRRNFSPVEAVAGFGRYYRSQQALADRPEDDYLEHLTEGVSFYAVDSAGAVPAYLSFKFPVVETADSVAPQPKEAPATKIRLLAIDDQSVILDLISAMGRSLGYQVTTAGSGEEGLRLAQRDQFDIILTDLTLPGLSGLDVARRLRKLGNEVPIILVTGWEASLEPSELAAAGINEVLYKPFRMEQLTDVVQSVVTVSRNRS
ncbi:MAG: response regulator [bacterium]|nr:response regulator [bacterium]